MPSEQGTACGEDARASRSAIGRVTAAVDVDPAVRRLVIVSDLHGYREPLEALDQRLTLFSEPSLVFVNGDIFEGGIDGLYALDWTMRHAADRTTRGNHDSAIFDYLKAEPLSGKGAPDDTELGAYRAMTPEQLDFVKCLPDILDLRWRGYSLRLMHGHLNLRTPARTNWRLSPAELSELFADREVDLTVIGHTHYPFVSQGAAGAVANPGSVAVPLFRHRDHSGRKIDRRADDPNLSVDDSRPSFLTVTEADGRLQPRIERFDYDRECLLRRHAARDGLRIPLDIRRAWIVEGRAP